MSLTYPNTAVKTILVICFKLTARYYFFSHFTLVLFFVLPQVTDVWISAPPRNFAFVTFTSAKGVDKVLADIPIRYGCHT